MLKNILTFLLTAFLTTTTSFAQEHINPCGTVGDLAAPMLERLLENLNTLENEPIQFRDVQYVPVRFHLVGKSDGTGRVSEIRVLDQLCILNRDYADMDIQFYLKGNDYFNYIDNTTVYDNHASATNTFMQWNRDNSAINVFIVNDATPPGNSGPPGGTTLAYHSGLSSQDWIVSRKDEIGDITTTLTHEVGHFFSLPHPFNGWDDSDPWTANSPAPTISPGSIPTERADGSNCTTAGDYICDTPADYNNGYSWDDCDYTGGAQDPVGMEIDPEERLFMSYFLDCSRDEYFFTPIQQNIVLTDLASSHRNYIRTNYSPPGEVTESAEPLGPIDGETTPSFGAVYFEWTAVPNASSYLMEVARNSSFTITPYRVITSNTNVTIADQLDADKTYYWRVRPFNNLYACVEFSDAAQFKTGTAATAVNEIKAVSGWSLEPNPVATNAMVNIHLNATTSFEANINLYNINGQLARQIGTKNFVAGENTFSVSTNGLSNGIYLVAIQTAEGQINKRLVVSN